MFMYDEPPPECWECLSKDNKMDDLKYWFTGVVDILYGKQPVADLHWYLEEIAHVLSMELPKGEVQVTQHQLNDFNSLLEAWKRSNTQYLKSLVNTGA